MRKMKVSIIMMALVAIFSALSLAAPVADSVEIISTNGSNLKAYVLVTQDVIDSLRQAGNLNGAFRVLDILRAKEKMVADSLASLAAAQKAVDDSLAAVQQAIDDSLAAIEERKNFWPNVKATMEEIPEDVDSLLYWADTPVKVAAVLLKYDVPKDWIEANLEYIEVSGGDIIISAEMNYVQTMHMIHRYTVELGGPAHRKLLGQDSVLISSKADQACLDETNVSLVETREAVELTFEMSTANSGNIQVLATELDGLKRSVWTCLEALKRTKIRKNQGNDNRQMMESLTAQSTTAVEPTKLKSTEL